MGKVKRLLFSKELDSERPDHYADKRSIELCETMHEHERNIRMEYDAEEFPTKADAIMRASQAWLQDGSPDPRPDRKTTYLDLEDIAPSPGVTPRRFEVEESEYPTLNETTIHVHYRNVRLEFSHREWLEFAEGIATALGRFHER